MATSKTEPFVALLRGINVGGKNKLPMKELSGLFTDAGCRNVRTFIQSGNVVFEGAPRMAAKLPAAMSARIEAAFGFGVPVILRSAAELQEALRHNPFLSEGAAEDTLHLMFLAGVPDSAAVAKLDPDRSPPDRFAVRGREIYLHTPGGFGNTRLTNAWFDGKLSTVSTVRNWRTSLKLLELMRN